MAGILSQLQEPLVMSMFASRDDLYREGERQRVAAAAEIERLRAALTKCVNNADDTQRVVRVAMNALTFEEGQKNGR